MEVAGYLLLVAGNLNMKIMVIFKYLKIKIKFN